MSSIRSISPPQPLTFLFDESADERLARFLARLGYDVKVAARDYPRSIADREVLALAVAEQRIVVTRDLDFVDLVFTQRLPHAGVLVYKLSSQAYPFKLARLQYVLDYHAHELREFVIVGDYD